MATRKILVTSYTWDTETGSYDVDIYSSGGVTHSAHVTITNDNGTAEANTVTFRSYHACNQYVKSLRQRTTEAA